MPEQRPAPCGPPRRRRARGLCAPRKGSRIFEPQFPHCPRDGAVFTTAIRCVALETPRLGRFSQCNLFPALGDSGRRRGLPHTVAPPSGGCTGFTGPLSQGCSDVTPQRRWQGERMWRRSWRCWRSRPGPGIPTPTRATEAGRSPARQDVRSRETVPGGGRRGPRVGGPHSVSAQAHTPGLLRGF